MNDLLRILIVEDNPADADFIRELMPDTGSVRFQFESVSRLSEAIARLERQGLDLILLDLSLPDSLGLPTLHQVRRAAPEVPVIVLSGNNDQDLAVIAVQAGAQDYLVKGQISGSLLVRAARYALERKRAEDAVLRSAQRHLSILRTAMDGFWRLDMQARLLEVNQTYCQMSGYTEPELLGMKISDLEAVESPSDTAARFKKIVEHGTDRFESSHRRKDGTCFLVEASVQYQPDEAGYVVVFLRDITERKRAADERERLIGDLQKALAQVKTLSGLLPICAGCKKIRDGENYWHQVESYVTKHTNVTFSHGLCPDCVKRLYPEFAEPKADQNP